ncbi:MAG: hypothetical protein L0229_08930 [Blastocatellia bacterium]|nr:hypothetical protein [Blastocatellia bacterium]
MMKVDMSAKAVTERLKRVSQLRRLCVSLSKAKPVEKEKPANRPPDSKQPDSK